MVTRQRRDGIETAVMVEMVVMTTKERGMDVFDPNIRGTPRCDGIVVISVDAGFRSTMCADFPEVHLAPSVAHRSNFLGRHNKIDGN